MSSEEWRELLTPEGVPYYFNASTNETTWDKPDCLKTEADAELDGEWVWAPDKQDGYIPARKLVNGDGSWKLEPERGMAFTVPKKDTAKIEALERRSLRQLQKVWPRPAVSRHCIAADRTTRWIEHPLTACY